MEKTCPTKFQRKRKKPPDPGGSSTPPEDSEDESTSMEEESKSTTMEGQNARNAKRSKLSTKPQYYNPDPIARMFGRANEDTVEVNGVSTTCLVDTGATVTIVNAEFCDHLGLAVHSIDGLISVSATGGTNIPYLGYTVATIEFPHILNYSEEVVMLVISDSSAYGSRVPLQIGTRVIVAVTETLKPEDIKHFYETWRQTYVETLMSCAIQGRRRHL